MFKNLFYVHYAFLQLLGYCTEFSNITCFLSKVTGHLFVSSLLLQMLLSVFGNCTVLLVHPPILSKYGIFNTSFTDESGVRYIQATGASAGEDECTVVLKPMGRVVR